VTREEPPPTEVPIEDAIDLHTFAPRDVQRVVIAYLEEARRVGFDEVRVIHGKGTGFQRARVREALETSPFVLSFEDAPPGRGAWGATLVKLRDPA
jgi:DNA-nicking Smr family endonuclease